MRKPAFVLLFLTLLVLGILAFACPRSAAARTVKPVLHAQHWLAITGKPLAATAGALTFAKGGNAVDAACAMLAATATMWDTLGWGGETQALIYHPGERRVIGINGLGIAPAGATVELFREQGMQYPPEFGPLAATTPGTPGALMTMLAEYGTLSLAEVLAPALAMADGYPIEASQADNMQRRADILSQWDSSRRVFLPHWTDCHPESPPQAPSPKPQARAGAGECRSAPHPGEIFRQPDLAATLRKLTTTEAEALAAGKTRKEAILAAYDRFYRGDIAEALVSSTREAGGLFTLEDLDRWEVKLEEPVSVDYRGIDVYKLTHWTQGPVMLQALNLLERLDLQLMGYNSATYIHTLYQVMNLAFADRDFYYGDPDVPPEEPIAGLLSDDYTTHRLLAIDWKQNDPHARPGDPYPFQGEQNPHKDLLDAWTNIPPAVEAEGEGSWQQSLGTGSAPLSPTDSSPARRAGGAVPVPRQGTANGEPRPTLPSRFAAGPGDVVPVPRSGTTNGASRPTLPSWNDDPALADSPFLAGTTSIQAADAEGWVVSVTPSGAWIPAFIAGDTGIGLSQRMQSFVLDPRMNPYNVLEPGKRPRVTLTPGMALEDGKPYLSFAVQGGDTQDQNLLQWFLNVVEFGMNPQEAAEAANINSYQMQSSFGAHTAEPGRIEVRSDVPAWVVEELEGMGYSVEMLERTSGPITGIWFDWENGAMWGAASEFGEDYGVGW
jgi:gamma-glutamyltranspeptidase/glutathione hydrolase